MHKNGYELEIALRELTELRQDAEHAKLVAELKKIKRENQVSLWRRVIGHIRFKSGKRPGSPVIKST
jgi:hypothetical protein